MKWDEFVNSLDSIECNTLKEALECRLGQLFTGEEEEHWLANRKIPAIKMFRSRTGASLKESKDLFEARLGRNPGQRPKRL